MAKKTSKFIIGLFVTVGIFLGTVTIVWLGASKYFRKGTTYATYFDESVQGLQVDSSVKYRGVEVGNVDKIRVAPDGRLIEVIMKISEKREMEKDVVAQLKSAGITGLVYIDLDKQEPGKPDRSPQLDFGAEYPIIPSRPSQIKEIFAGVEGVFKKIEEIDFKGISEQMKGTSKAIESASKGIETTFAGPRMNSVIANLDIMTARLDKTAQSLDRITSEGKIDDVLKETKAGIADARSLISSTREELKALKLGDTVERANLTVERVDRRTRTIAQEIEAASENLRRTSETLDEFMQRVRTNPSDLIFSKPPTPRRD